MKIQQTWPMSQVGPPVDVDGGVVPQWWTVLMTYDDPPTTVGVRIALVNGRFQATGLSFNNPEGVPLRLDFVADVVQRLPKVVTRDVLTWQTTPFELAGREIGAEDAVEFESRILTRQRRRDITDEHLAAVAEVYNGATKRPARAVEQHFVTSPATASRWIKLAREAGFIKPKGEA